VSLPSKTPYRDSDYYYDQMNSVFKEGFSLEQKKEIKRVLQRAIKMPSKKIINLEITFWFFKRFYLVIYLGNDCRKKTRLLDERTFRALLKFVIKWFITVVLWGATFIVLGSVIYYAKSVMGIDIFPEKHMWDFMPS